MADMTNPNEGTKTLPGLEVLKGWCASLRKAPVLQGVLISVLFLWAAVFVASMFSGNFVQYLQPKFGITEKRELMTFLGVGMGGLLLALQAVTAYRRSKAMEDNVSEQTKANKHTEEGLLQGRLRDAIEHLGNKSDSVRLGGAYELFHLANDNASLRKTVLDILSAHIRVTTRRSDYRNKYEWEPSEEIQSLLELLFMKPHDVFDGLLKDLGGSWLNGTKLQHARLDRAWLIGASLRGASLSGAELRYANLCNVHLHGAYLMDARLDGAILLDACLQSADLDRAKMRGADLWGAQMQGADLSHTQMQAARVRETEMQGARFQETRMQGVHPSPSAKAPDPLRQQAGQDSDFGSTIFGGDLDKQKFDQIVENMPENKRAQFQSRVQPHVGQKRSSKLPSGIITERYTAKEALEWVEEIREGLR